MTEPAHGASERPSNPEVENENQRPAHGASGKGGDGKPPRPATEPPGAESSTDSPKTRTDPGSGEA